MLAWICVNTWKVTQEKVWIPFYLVICAVKCSLFLLYSTTWSFLVIQKSSLSDGEDIAIYNHVYRRVISFPICAIVRFSIYFYLQMLHRWWIIDLLLASFLIFHFSLQIIFYHLILSLIQITGSLPSFRGEFNATWPPDCPLCQSASFWETLFLPSCKYGGINWGVSAPALSRQLQIHW